MWLISWYLTVCVYNEVLKLVLWINSSHIIITFVVMFYVYIHMHICNKLMTPLRLDFSHLLCGVLMEYIAYKVSYMF